MKVALIQMNSQGDKAANLEQARRLIEQAVAEERPDLVALPEVWTMLSEDAAAKRAAAEPIPGGEAYGLLQELAARHRILLHGGSVIEQDGDALCNTTVVFGRDGRELARYRKLHLFDITTPDGKEYRESATFTRGARVITFDAEGTRFGLSICYDLRFSELYLQLAKAGAKIILVPAAFTLQTGKDHWEVLLEGARDRDPDLRARTRPVGPLRRRRPRHLRPQPDRRSLGPRDREGPGQARLYLCPPRSRGGRACPRPHALRPAPGAVDRDVGQPRAARILYRLRQALQRFFYPATIGPRPPRS